MWFTRELVFLFYYHILKHIKPRKEITITCALSLDFGKHYGNRHFFNGLLLSYIKSTDCSRRSGYVYANCFMLEIFREVFKWTLTLFLERKYSSFLNTHHIKRTWQTKSWDHSVYAPLVKAKIQLKGFNLGMKVTYYYFTLCFLLKTF